MSNELGGIVIEIDLQAPFENVGATRGLSHDLFFFIVVACFNQRATANVSLFPRFFRFGLASSCRGDTVH